MHILLSHACSFWPKTSHKKFVEHQIEQGWPCRVEEEAVHGRSSFCATSKSRPRYQACVRPRSRLTRHCSLRTSKDSPISSELEPSKPIGSLEAFGETEERSPAENLSAALVGLKSSDRQEKSLYPPPPPTYSYYSHHCASLHWLWLFFVTSAQSQETVSEMILQFFLNLFQVSLLFVLRCAGHIPTVRFPEVSHSLITHCTLYWSSIVQ